ncbi:hypothetical protein V9K67_18630 [Paraflavisolibacter sp. H34]|uniref:hypothetical protein n=1 Tax=Huijunlia imazamoxiresistens TaxID=3127457 RepID=UPI0030176554
MRKRANELLDRLHQLGSELDLSFSSQQLLRNGVMGLDGIRRHLLVVTETGKGDYDWEVMALNAIESCSVKKTYRTIHANALKGRGLDDYLECILLRFELAGGRKPVEVPFYRSGENDPEEMPALEQRVRNWQVMLSKMLSGKVKQYA